MLIRAAVASLVLAGVTSAQTVLVVDGAGGSPFTEIGDALLAADPGDVVLVKSGHYDEFLGINEGVSLMADAGATVSLTSLSIQNIPADETVRLRGITVTEGPGASPGSLRVQTSDGPVFIEECVVLSAAVPFQSGGVRINNCDAVVMTDSVIVAPDLSLASIGASLTVINSSVWVFDSEISGRNGAAAAGPFGFVTSGDPAAQVTGGYLAIAGSTLRGGKGGDGQLAPTCTAAADGGRGLGVDGDALVYIADSVVEGGAGGAAAGTPGCEAGNDGDDTFIFDGTITEANPDALVRGLATNSPIREGELLTVSLTDLDTAPGDFAWIMFSTSPTLSAGSPASTFTGLLALDAPTLLVLGPLPVTPTLDLSVIVPELGPGFDLAQLDLQGLVLDVSASSFVPSAPSTITLIDSGF